jgi:hypothetical protein
VPLRVLRQRADPGLAGRLQSKRRVSGHPRGRHESPRLFLPRAPRRCRGCVAGVPRLPARNPPATSWRVGEVSCRAGGARAGATHWVPARQAPTGGPVGGSLPPSPCWLLVLGHRTRRSVAAALKWIGSVIRTATKVGTEFGDRFVPKSGHDSNRTVSLLLAGVGAVLLAGL